MGPAGVCSRNPNRGPVKAWVCPETRFLVQIEVGSVPTKETDRMKRSRFGEEQIIAILKQQESGVATADVCREHGISSATFYK